MRRAGWSRALLGLLALFLVVTVGGNALWPGTFFAEEEGELPVYVRAGERLVDGEGLYRPDDAKPFTYPPFAAAPFVPFAALPSSAGRPLWYACNLLLVGVAVRLLSRRLVHVPGRAEYARRPPAWLFWTLVALLAGRHVAAVFSNQANDAVVLLLVTGAVVASARGRDLACGAAAGAGAAFKATPLLFAPVLALQRRFAAAAAVLVGAALLLAATELAFPRADGARRTAAWFETFVVKQSVTGPAEAVGGAWGAWNVLNQSLSGTLHRLFTAVDVDTPLRWDVALVHLDRGALRALTLAAQLVVVAAIAWASRPGLARGLADEALARRRLGEGALVACGMVLLSPMSSKSHFCVLLLPIAFCLESWLYVRRSLLVGVALLIVAVGSFTSKGLLGRELGQEVLARGPVTLAALAALCATAWALRDIRGRPGAAEQRP